MSPRPLRRCAPRGCPRRRRSTASSTTRRGPARRCRPARGCRTTRCTATQIAQQTTVWVGYDADALYFAFRCDDPEPCRHQDVDHAPRQHLERRLGGPEPRRARHRAGVLPPDGQPERHPARHDQHHRRLRGHVAGLDLGERRPRQRHAATPSRSDCRCRPSASRAAPTCRWASCSGAASAASASRWPGRRSSPASGCSRSTRSSAFTDLQARPTRELIPSATYSRAQERATPSDWGRRQHRRSRPQREVGSHLHGHARRDGEPGLQPGRKRRVPGGGEPALPGLLLGEAAVLHGRRRHLQPRRQRPGRRLDALRRPHAQHRRSDLRRQAHRLGRTRDLRHAHGGRPGARPHRRSRSIRCRARRSCSRSRARR